MTISSALVGFPVVAALLSLGPGFHAELVLRAALARPQGAHADACPAVAAAVGGAHPQRQRWCRMLTRPRAQQVIDGGTVGAQIAFGVRLALVPRCVARNPQRR